MTEHAANGIYDGAAITLWERGSSAAVIWNSGAKHRGKDHPGLYQKMYHIKQKVCEYTL